MKPINVQQIFIGTAAILGIGLFWINIYEKVLSKRSAISFLRRYGLVRRKDECSTKKENRGRPCLRRKTLCERSGS